MKSDHAIEEIYKDLVSGKRKTIGWGTGSFFQYYFRLIPIRLDYIVDNNPDRWGKRIAGVSIKSPEALAAEDPENVFILIYSSFVEQITEQIRTLGDYTALPASFVAGYEDMCFLKKKMASKLEENSPLNRQPSGRRAIIVQGPLANDFAVENIQFYAHTFPEDTLIVSTWEASNPLYIQQIEPYVDHVLLNTPPEFAGHQNRNYQIKSTLAGLKKAQELGVSFALKTRTDLALMSENLLSGCENLFKLYSAKVCQKMGFKNRLIIPEVYTRKYVLYHPGDLIMFGHLKDMLTFWDLPYDERRINILENQWLERTLKEMGVDMGPAESYLGRRFAEKIGRPMENTLQDYWNFLRDHFIVVDSSWLDIFWHKYPRLVGSEISNTLHHCVNHYFWQQLYFGTADIEKLTHAVDIEASAWSEFHKASDLPELCV